MARLARHLAGRSVGLLLTGSGGRGLLHLGALRALADANVPVDVVGGTGHGALVREEWHGREWHGRDTGEGHRRGS